jgi:hypothetical protein
MGPVPKPEKEERAPELSAAVDPVEEASQESFPASDAPAWTGLTGEKGNDGGETAASPDSKTRGCAVSYIMQQRGELGGACGALEPDPNEQWVQPEKEREAGGEEVNG